MSSIFNKVVIAFISIAFILSANTGAFASPKGKKSRKAKAKVNTKWEEKVDKNDDGVVDKVEAAKSNNSFKANEKAKVNRPWEHAADTNNDGVISKEEKQAWNNSKIKEKAEVDTKWEEKADKNDDGIVERAEKRLLDKKR